MSKEPLNPEKFKKIGIVPGDTTLKEVCKTMLLSNTFSTVVVVPKKESSDRGFHVHVALCAADHSAGLARVISAYLEAVLGE